MFYYTPILFEKRNNTVKSLNTSMIIFLNPRVKFCAISYSALIHFKIQLFYITMSVENIVQSLTEVYRA